MNRADYLKSDDGRVHVINAEWRGATMTAGILCALAMSKTTTRICDDTNSFFIELPEGFCSKGDRVKAFNVDLTILKNE
tara:strand:+ start:503 stop:739 length:237 start_codon:yes stop_codon:yes gene_type:complete